MDVKKLFEAKVDRRRVLGNLGMMGAGAVLAACGVSAQPDTDPDPAEVDKAILNFALNLEYLEAEYYLAAVGRAPSYETAGMGTVQTSGPVNFADAEIEAYANEIANHEEAHVVFLRNALGADAVNRPDIDLRGGPGNVFGVAARTAGEVFGVTDPEDLDALAEFNPYLNDLFFLHGAFIFEDVGVTAYKGASPLIDDAMFLEAAAGILAVEAYHAGEIRTLLYQERDTVAIPANFAGHSNQAFQVRTIVAAISALRGFLGNGKDQPIVDDMGNANIVPADDNAIAFSRTPREVLDIVYGAEDASSGLFFPNGVNGDFSLLM